MEVIIAHLYRDHEGIPLAPATPIVILPALIQQGAAAAGAGVAAAVATAAGAGAAEADVAEATSGSCAQGGGSATPPSVLLCYGSFQHNCSPLSFESFDMATEGTVTSIVRHGSAAMESRFLAPHFRPSFDFSTLRPCAFRV